MKTKTLFKHTAAMVLLCLINLILFAQTAPFKQWDKCVWGTYNDQYLAVRKIKDNRHGFDNSIDLKTAYASIEGHSINNLEYNDNNPSTHSGATRIINGHNNNRNEIVNDRCLSDFTSGIIAAWNLDGNAFDASGNGHDGTVVGTIPTTTDLCDNNNAAFFFDGNGKDQYIDVPDADPLDLANTDFTISTWVKVSYNGNITAAISKRVGSNLNDGYIFVIGRNVNWAVAGGAPGSVGFWNTHSIDSSIWSNVVLTYNNQTDTVKLYINGILDTAVGNMPSPTATGSPLRIGSDAFIGNYEFSGKIDDIKIYSRALNSCDIVGLYNSKKQVFYADQDNDGFGNPSNTIYSCSPPAGYVSSSGDCNDSNANVHPNAIEICGNGIDDNCNGLIDEGCSICANATNLTTTNVTSSSAVLNWIASVNPSRWQVQYKKMITGATWTKVSQRGSARSVAISSLTTNQKYRWRIRALCSGTWTALSTAVSFKTLAAALQPLASTENKPAEQSSALRLYPNPSAGNFTVQYSSVNSGKVQLKVVDMTGRTVFISTAVAVNGSNTYHLNLSQLSAGTYYLQIINNKELNRIKFVIQK